MAKPIVFDLSEISPTMVPDALRAAAAQAFKFAADPMNAVDNNPFISREWLALGLELQAAAAAVDRHFDSIFGSFDWKKDTEEW